MKRLRVVIICTGLLLFALLLALYRVGKVNKNLNELKSNVSGVNNRIKDLKSSIDELRKLSTENKESIVNDFVLNFDKYDPIKNNVKLDYEVILKEIENEEDITLIANNQDIKLKKDGIKFVSSYEFGLEDLLDNYVIYKDKKTSKIVPLKSPFQGMKFGDLVLPKNTLDVQEKVAERSDSGYKIKTKLILQVNPSKVGFKPNDNSIKMKDDSFALHIDVAGENYKTIELGQEKFTDNSINIELDEEVKAEKHKEVSVYIQAEDDYGLIYKSYLENENDKEFLDNYYTLVVNPNSKQEVYRYK